MKFNFTQSKKNKIYFATLWRNALHEYVNPHRDWTIGLFVAVVVFLIGIGYVAFDFYAQFGASKDAVYVESQSVGYRDVEVRKFAEEYEERERIFRELQEKRVTEPNIETRNASTTLIETPEPVISATSTEEVLLLADPELSQ